MMLIIGKGFHGAMVTIVGSGLGYTSSNPEWGCLHFT